MNLNKYIMGDIIEIQGVVEEGLRHCSGYDKEGKPFRYYGKTIGSIKSQRPFFEEAIPAFSEIHNGTINVGIHPRTFEIMEPDHIMSNCKWDPGRDAENFWLVELDLVHNDKSYQGYLYYPCPSDWKKRPENNTLEILSPFIKGLNYEDSVLVRYDSDKIKIN